jgi:hypothetical protein
VTRLVPARLFDRDPARYLDLAEGGWRVVVVDELGRQCLAISFPHPDESEPDDE